MTEKQGPPHAGAGTAGFDSQGVKGAVLAAGPGEIWTLETGSLYSGWRTYPQELFATAVSVVRLAALGIEDRGAVAAA